MKRHFQNRDDRILLEYDERFLSALLAVLLPARIVFSGIDEFSKNVPAESFPAE